MSKASIFFFLLTFVSNYGLSQKKYQGLLWEISGNGLEEPSYLYGTMHVSNKLAFNVSDSFYYCLNSVDAVALESSPEGWMEEYRDMGSMGGGLFGGAGDFYKNAFEIKQPQSDVMFNLLENKNGLMNQILYRFNPGAEDYQENTYLDMFIFQAGAKQGKPIYSLETFKEVMELSIKALMPDKDKEEDNSFNQYLQNNGQNKFALLEDAYRRGDLDQIDSLSKADNPTSSYHKYFIVQRNKNMVNRLDSLMKNQSVFTGIGAAHLPGEEGAIELLRNLGYKVRAVDNKSSGKGHKMRKKIEEMYKEVSFAPTSTFDGFITVHSPGKLYEMPTYQRGKMEYLCPEPINGGYFSVVRRSTFGPIYKKSSDYYKVTFDSLEYMATPGDIIKKENIVVNGHKGYQIQTKTSKDAIIYYRVFFTPLEIIVLKGSGNGNYIQKSGPQSFFNKLQLAPASSDWQEVTPKFGGYQWKMKGMVIGQDQIEGMDDSDVNPFYQSYDQSTGAYYQVMKYQLNDLDYIEEDSFDLAYLGKMYAENLGYDISSSIINSSSPVTFVEQELTPKKSTKGQIDHLSIKVLTIGANYFLMATTAEEGDKEVFFNSFSTTDFDLSETFEEVVDSSLYFKVNTIKNEEKIDYLALTFNYFSMFDKDKEDRSFLSETKEKLFHNHQRKEAVRVKYLKFHDYASYDSLSIFWDKQIKNLTSQNKMIVSRKEQSTQNDDPIVTFLLTDTGSCKGITTKMQLHHGVLYTLQALIDTIQGPSQFVQTFFETFTPLDTLIGRNIFEDKGQVFLTHAIGTDSLKKVNAMKSINRIDFSENDVPGIIDLYHNFEYDEDEETIQREDIIMALGNQEVQEAYDFLYAVYDSNNFKSDLQFIVLKCFSYTESKEAYHAVKDLLLNNTPFAEQNFKLGFFNNLYDSLELASDYFPKMLELVVYPEYKPHVVELLAYGFIEGYFDYENFQSKQDIIMRDAYIELKRTVANQNEEDEDDYYFRDDTPTMYNNLFLDYYTLMCGFKKFKAFGTEKFFKDIYRITDKTFLLEAEIIHHKLGLKVDTAKINQVVADIDYRVWAYNRLDHEDMLDYFPSHISQEDMAFALLYKKDYDEEDDSIQFLKRVYVDNGKEQGFIYFFKRKTKNQKNWTIDYVGLQPEDESLLLGYYTDYKKGLAVKNEEEIEQTIDKAIEIFELKNRKRVVVGTFDFGFWGGLF